MGESTSAQTKQERSRSMIQVALAYAGQGYRPIPIEASTKMARVRWKEFQQRTPTLDEITKWWTQHPEDNIALLTGERCPLRPAA